MLSTHLRRARPAGPAHRGPASVFGRFALRRVLGEGAQAVVWLAFDPRLEREVALKLMRAPAGADPVAVGEWLREARSVSRLNHPHIVQVYDADAAPSSSPIWCSSTSPGRRWPRT